MRDFRSLTLRRGVVLLPLQMSHASRMFEWMQDPLVSQNLGLRTSPSLERTEQWITNALQDETICPFAVHWENKHVGNVVLDRIDRYLASARLSVYIGEASARGAGIGQTAIYLALAAGFERFDLNKVWLTVHVRNLRAINTYLRLGFVLEGILRDEFILNGEFLPVLYLGLLRSEFAHIQVEWETR